MVNVGIIGTGSFGNKRAEAVKQCKNARLLKFTNNINDIIRDDKVDMVIVCSPASSHISTTIFSLNAGKHVLCEKPMALNSTEARQMINTARNNRKFLKIGSNHRYFASIRAAGEILRSGVIGDIISFNGRIGHNGNRTKNTWYSDKRLSGGGTLIDNGHHLIDIAKWFMGPLTNGVGVLNSYIPNSEVEDMATITFALPKGEMVVINSSWRQLSNYLRIEINGTGGWLEVTEKALRWQGEGCGTHTIDYGNLENDSLKLELEYFFRCIEKGTEPSPSGKDGLDIIKIIEKAYEK